MQQRKMRRVTTIATAAVAMTGMAVASAPHASAATTPTAMIKITNTVPRWLSQATTPTVKANAVTEAPMAVTVYLAPNGGLAALKAAAFAISTPGSATYGHWLSVAQYDAAYSPTTAQANVVATYLKKSGLSVTGLEANNRYITASGTKAQLQTAFGVTLGTYTHDGQTVIAPSGPVTLPATVGLNVLTVTGLDTTTVINHHDSLTATPAATPAVTPAATPAEVVTPPAAFVNAKPCNIDFGNVLATYQGDYSTPLPKFMGQVLPYVPCGYTGPQLRGAYEGTSTADGTGITVGIVDAYNWQYIGRDSNQYAGLHGDAAYAPGQLTQSYPKSYTHQTECEPSGWSGEETLDVEATHAMAPGANIKYYGAASCYDSDLTDALARAVHDDQVQVITNSYGDTEENASDATIAAYEQVFLQGAMQGQTFLFSSGDDGDELANTGILQADYPASDPYVVAVGGTSTEINNFALTGQTGWGTESAALSADGKSWGTPAYLYGAGGGYSELFNRPSWQTAAVPKTAPAGRAVPDIAMDADPQTGMLIGQTQTFPDSVHYGEYRIGGTSLASPLAAGMFALAIQNRGGGGFGHVNALLYQNQKNVFTDVLPSKSPLGVVRVNNKNSIDNTAGVTYSVRTFDQDSSLTVTKGYDDVTGLGVLSPTFLTAFAKTS